MTCDEAMTALQGAHQPAGADITIAEIRSDGHLAARALFAPLENAASNPTAGAYACPTCRSSFDGVGALPGPVPRLGKASVEELLEDR